RIASAIPLSGCSEPGERAISQVSPGHRRMELDPMTTPAAESSSPIPQPVTARLTRAAIFLVVTINPDADSGTKVRSLCADLAALLRAIGFREPAENLCCIMA